MCQYLSSGEFRIIPLQEVDISEILATPVDADYGYFLEVDLSYPKSLHDYFNEFLPVQKRKPRRICPPFNARCWPKTFARSNRN